MEGQIRDDIQKIIRQLPEKQLQPLLDFLKIIKNAPKDKSETTLLIQKIFLEDVSLLKKLAE